MRKYQNGRHSGLLWKSENQNKRGGIMKIMGIVIVFVLLISNMAMMVSGESTTPEKIIANADFESSHISDEVMSKVRMDGNPTDIIPGEIIVGYREGVSKFSIREKLSLFTDSRIKISPRGNFAVVSVTPDEQSSRMLEIAKDSYVEYVEPNYFCRIAFTPNDPFYSTNQWGPQRIKAPLAWDSTTGSSSVIVAVLDTGVDYTHTDLVTNIWNNPSEIDDNGLDDDGNGYFDDYYGFDFVNSVDDITNDVDGPLDDHSHGTHVSGIIAAEINNAIGIAGMAQVKIMAIKVLDSAGSGTFDDLANGIYYATDNGANIISMSLCSSSGSSLVSNAIDYAWNAGVTLVAASGNDNLNSIYYPARYSNVIAVGALNETNGRCNENDWGIGNGSNYGSQLDLIAPGNNIYSTIPGSYGYKSGTSMATPFVTGVAALLLSIDLNLHNTQIRTILRDTADDLGAGGWDSEYGYGRVDAYEAVNKLFLLDEVTRSGYIDSYHTENGYGFTAKMNDWNIVASKKVDSGTEEYYHSLYGPTGFGGSPLTSPIVDDQYDTEWVLVNGYNLGTDTIYFIKEGYRIGDNTYSVELQNNLTVILPINNTYAGSFDSDDISEGYIIYLSTGDAIDINLDVADGYNDDLYLYSPSVGVGSGKSNYVMKSTNGASIDESFSYTATTTGYFSILIINMGGLSAHSFTLSVNFTQYNDPPSPVTLYQPPNDSISETTVILEWTENADSDFNRYEIYQSSTSGVLGSSVKVIESSSENSTVITGLSSSTTYWFTVRVYDNGEKYADSNQIGVTTKSPNTPPTAVTLNSPTESTENTLTLSWNQNVDADFALYKVYQSSTSGVLGSLIHSIGTQTTISYVVTGLSPSSTYYFTIRVVDTGSLYSDSNQVSGTTLAPNTAPTAVTLNTPDNETENSMQLSWTQNTDSDFASYQIYQSTTSGLLGSLIHTIGTQASTLYIITSLSSSSTYYFTVRVVDTGSLYADSNQVSGTTLATNTAPTAVTLDSPTNITESSMTLNWSQNSDSDFASYQIYQSTTSGQLGTLIQTIGTQTTTTYVVTGLSSSSTYYFTIRVVDTGLLYADSNQVSGTTLPTNTVPIAVTLNSPADITNESLSLSWSQNADSDFASYQIYQSATSGQLGSLIHTIGTLSTTSYVVTGLSPSSIYYFTVRVIDTGSLYADSNQVSGTTLATNTAPSAVTLTSPSNITETSMTLTWTQNSDSDFASYQIYQSTTSGQLGSLIYTIGTQTTITHIVTGLSPSSTYYFTVRVVDTGTLYADSNQVSGTTLATNTVPTAVTLNTPTNITENFMTLSWSQNADTDFAYYQIYQSTTSGQLGSLIHTIGTQSTTSYIVTSLSPSTTYYFTVRVIDTGSLYADSNQVSGMTLATNTAPTAVTLNSPTDITETSMTLSWSQNADSDFASYQIYQSATSGLLGSLIHTIGTQTTTSYIVTGLTSDSIYYFTVRVIDTGSLYSDSNQVSGTTLATNTQPTAVTLNDPTDITEGSMNLSWTPNADADFASYQIYQSTTFGQLGTLIQTIGTQSTTCYIVTGLSPSTPYYFTVRVIDAGSLTADSIQKSGLTLTPNTQPTAVTLNDPTDITENSMNLSWSQNADADFASYQIYQSTTFGQLGTLIHTIGTQSTTDYIVTGLSSSTTYHFIVRVVDTGSLTADSTQKSGITLAPNTQPTAVTLNNPTDITENFMTLSWSQNADTDFAYYQIYKSTTFGQLGSSIKTIGTQSTTSYIVTGLSPSTTYYFIVRVVDTGSLYVDSTQKSGTTLGPNAQPTSVTLNDPTNITESSMMLNWSQNIDSDFASYQIYQSTTDGQLGTLIHTIGTQSVISFVVTGLSSSTKYFFIVKVIDSGTLTADSIQVNGTTLASNVSPTAVTLDVPTNVKENSMELNWTENTDTDFAVYKIYQSTTSGQLWTLIDTISDQSETSYIVIGLTSSTTYYFIVQVVDTGSLTANSTQKSGTTLAPNAQPTAVTLNDSTDITDSSMTLSWSQNSDGDFASYGVYQSTTSGQLGSLIHTIDSQSTTSYLITGLSPTSTYYFRIRVADVGGLYTDSNQVSGTTTSSGSGVVPATLEAILSAHPLTVNISEDITFDASGSSGPISEYYFDYGDGENSGWVSTPTVFHTFAQDGKYTIKLKVRDANGNESDYDTLQITVNGPATGGETEITPDATDMTLPFALIAVIIALAAIIAYLVMRGKKTQKPELFEERPEVPIQK